MNPTEIKILRSNRRQRTISAILKGNTLLVQAPQDIPQEQLDKIIGNFKKRFARRALKKQLNSQDDLKKLADTLNAKYFSNAVNFNSIEYVTNQEKKFGCCSTFDRNIRISHHVAPMPDWVKNYVVIHEMAHILEPNHGKGFWQLVNRYPLAERARGYLIAKGIEPMEFEPGGATGAGG